MSYPVKYYRSNQTGAPVLSGTKGAMTAVLDACLVTGFALKGITSIAWADGTATVTVDGGHGYEDDDILLIEGAEPAAFNGEQRIRIVSPASFTYALPDPGVAAAQGAMSVKIAPLGWERVLERANVAVYRSRRPESTRYLLRVNHDADARHVRVRGYLAMSTVDTGTEPFPTTGYAEAGLLWGASDQVSTAARSWSLIGDDRLFYFLPRQNPSYGHSLYGFGDITPYKPGDAHGCILMGQENNDTSYPDSGLESRNLRNGAGRFIAKRHFQVGGSVRFTMAGSIVSPYFGRGQVFPSPIDNAVHLYRVEVQDDQMRGQLPGLLQCIEEWPFHHRFVLKDVPGLGPELRDVLFHDIQDGRASFDLTGPWRSGDG